MKITSVTGLTLKRFNKKKDASEDILPFQSQPTTNFSGYDISQGVDWECLSLSPHILLHICISILLTRKGSQAENKAMNNII